MRPEDVSSYEMSDFSNIRECDLRALLSGQVPSDDPSLGDVAAFLADLDVAVPEPSSSHCEASHLAAMFEQAHLLAEKGEPAVMSGSKADGPDDQVSGLPKPRRKTMLDKLKGSPVFAKLKGASLTAKIAAVTTAFMVLFSGMAFAGALPGPLQDATADALSAAGIELPGGVDEAVAPAVDEDEGAGETAGEAIEAEDADDDADEALDPDADDDADDADAEDAEDVDDDADEAEDADDDPDYGDVDAVDAEDVDDDADEAEEADEAEDDSDDDSSDDEGAEEEEADSED